MVYILYIKVLSVYIYIYIYTVNQEFFVHESIYVNKFLWVFHKNILTRKFCQVEIAVHVLPIMRLLATYITLFCS